MILRILLLTLAGFCFPAQPQAAAKPNVLFLAVDDLNDWIGALGGHPQAKTPNLDRLIAKSVNFSNAHCAAPVCSASRHALMSGLRPSTTGWYSNTSKKRADYERALNGVTPLPTHFKRNGYKTLAAGKIFHKGTSDVAGYDYWTEARPKYKWPKKLAARGHGYQGKSGGHFHPFPPDGGAIYQKYQKGVDGQSLCWGALEKADMPPEGMPDEQIAAWAIERLKQKHEQPFFLAVGFVRPHVPYTAPKEFFDLYPLKDVVVPKVPGNEMDDIPLHGKAMAKGTIEGGDHWNVLGIGPEYWKEMTRAYLACVSFVDAQAGKVLDALEAGPYADNTIIVFWSDHGQHLGEKRHWRKQALWEEATRVPLSIHVPGAANAGQDCDRAVSLLDIYPTLIELCGLPSMKGLEGVSLRPQLADPSASRGAPVVTTWHYNNHAIRGPRWRYIRYRDGSEELYNHSADPQEHVNQAANPKFASIKERFKKYLPTQNALPASMKDGGLDSHGRKVEALKENGIPDWLGGEGKPAAETKQPAAALSPEERLTAMREGVDEWLDPDHSTPAGTLYETFRSKAIDGESSYLIYLPISYAKRPQKRYPVVYWLHGARSSQRTGFYFVERLNRAIESDAAGEMIVVLANGRHAGWYFDRSDGSLPAESILIKDLIPHIDRKYRTIANRSGRALEGWSMGGFGALRLGFKFPEMFSAVSSLAGSTWILEEGKTNPPTWNPSWISRYLGSDASLYRSISPWALAESNADQIRDRVAIRMITGRDGGTQRRERMREKLKDLNLACEFINVTGAGHSYVEQYEKLNDRQIFGFYREAFGN